MPLSSPQLYGTLQKNNYTHLNVPAYFQLMFSMFCIGIFNYITATFLPQFINLENLAAYQINYYSNCSQNQKLPVCHPNFGKLKYIFCTLSSKYSKTRCYLSQYFYEVQKKISFSSHTWDRKLSLSSGGAHTASLNTAEKFWRYSTSTAFHGQKLCHETLHRSLSLS